MFTVSEDGPASAMLATSQVVDWGVHTVGSESAWRRGITGSGVRVAVLDTGLVEHPDLPSVQNVAGAPDTLGHGTHVAGIIGAANNNFGVVGVAPGSHLMIYQCLPGPCQGIADRIDQAVADGAQVINLSGGSPDDDQAVHDAVRRAYAAGVVIVAAAGNTPSLGIQYPARYPEVIAVSAVDADGHLAGFAPLLDTLEAAPSRNHVYCPGVSVLSTWIGNQYARLNGTSQAAPIVTGMVALLLSYFRPTRDVVHDLVARELALLASTDASFHYVPRLESM